MTLYDNSKDICEELVKHSACQVVIQHYQETGEVAVECNTCYEVLLSFFPYNIDEEYPTSDSMTEMLGAGQIMNNNLPARKQ